MGQGFQLPELEGLTLGSTTGVVTWGQGMNLIKIVGLLTEKEIPSIVSMMEHCLGEAEQRGARRNIGFYLDSEGGTHEAISQLIAHIGYFREQHKFQFYVEVKRAVSAAVLIVAIADVDKRGIFSDGKLVIYDGDVRLKLTDFMENGQPYPGHHERLKTTVEFYRMNLWSPTRLDFHKLSAEQKTAYRTSSELHLTANQCIEMWGFKNKG